LGFYEKLLAVFQEIYERNKQEIINFLNFRLLTDYFFKKKEALIITSPFIYSYFQQTNNRN
jgi:hypothetical protein